MQQIYNNLEDLYKIIGEKIETKDMQSYVAEVLKNYPIIITSKNRIFCIKERLLKKMFMEQVGFLVARKIFSIDSAQTYVYCSEGNSRCQIYSEFLTEIQNIENIGFYEKLKENITKEDFKNFILFDLICVADYHFQNIVIKNNKIYLIDLDTFGQPLHTLPREFTLRYLREKSSKLLYIVDNEITANHLNITKESLREIFNFCDPQNQYLSREEKEKSIEFIYNRYLEYVY